ncbi:MAG: hypothetical protein WCS37_03970, partial [Chloroflexota bacterium]
MKFEFKRFNHHKISVGLLLLSAMLVFAACGDTVATATPTLPTVATVTTPLPGDVAARPDGTARANFSPPVSGTVESYDATAKTLTVKGTDGKSQSFDATNARLTKTEKTTLDELGKLLANNGIVQVTGEKGSDGSYNATAKQMEDEVRAQAKDALPDNKLLPDYAVGKLQSL